MGILQITEGELANLQAFPLPYWANEERAFLGQVLVGEPGVETDNEGNPTGYLLFSHPQVTRRELFLMDVLRAFWAHLQVNSDPDKQANTHVQIEWAAWLQLKSEVEAGRLTEEQAAEAAWQHVLKTAYLLGLEYVEEPEAEDE
jgi:hypothetical protein